MDCLNVTFREKIKELPAKVLDFPPAHSMIAGRGDLRTLAAIV